MYKFILVFLFHYYTYRDPKDRQNDIYCIRRPAIHIPCQRKRHWPSTANTGKITLYLLGTIE